LELGQFRARLSELETRRAGCGGRLLEISVSATGLQSLGTALEALPADHPISGLLRGSKDFRRPGAMADALLNPQDRAYTVAEIYAWLERCGMSFGRWIEQAPYLAQCGVLAGSPHASRLAALPSRLQHAAAELFRGAMGRSAPTFIEGDHVLREAADRCTETPQQCCRALLLLISLPP
jgi:hypothetical protein